MADNNVFDIKAASKAYTNAYEQTVDGVFQLTLKHLKNAVSERRNVLYCPTGDVPADIANLLIKRLTDAGYTAEIIAPGSLYVGRKKNTKPLIRVYGWATKSVADLQPPAEGFITVNDSDESEIPPGFARVLDVLKSAMNRQKESDDDEMTEDEGEKTAAKDPEAKIRADCEEHMKTCQAPGCPITLIYAKFKK